MRYEAYIATQAGRFFEKAGRRAARAASYHLKRLLIATKPQKGYF